MAEFKAKICAEIVEARFAYSGKVASVNKKPGESVKIGDLLASLNRKQHQTTLDKELADFEKVRAEFEIFVINNPNPNSDLIKYEKTRVQALLNASVKAVELAKITLDETDLRSPVNGFVIDNNCMRNGMYITPGSYAYQLVDMDSLVAEIECDEKDSKLFITGEKVKLKYDETETTGTVLPLIPTLKEKQIVRVKPDTIEGLTLGVKVQILMTTDL